MLNKRRFCLKWTSILIAYICIFLLSYEFGTNNRNVLIEDVTSESEPEHLLIKRLFHDHGEYMNTSMILSKIESELKYPLRFDIDENINQTSIIHHGLVIFYDYSYHNLYFQQFLWLYSSWIQLQKNSEIKNDLIVFITSTIIPNDFQKLLNLTKNFHHNNENEFLIYPCQTLINSILNRNYYEFLSDFSSDIHMELGRLFYWQQTRLSSLLSFLHYNCQKILSKYDYIFRLDIDSFLMSKFSFYSPTNSLILGQSISYDGYTLNRLKRIEKYFQTQSKNFILKQSMTINWFGKLEILNRLTRQIVLMTIWLIKEEFTESERLHHLTYLNYPSWYMDGIFEYATAIILSLNQYDNNLLKKKSQFDCHHVLTNCLHISFRDPSHHLHLSKHSLQLLTNINQSNLTENELYIYQTVIKSNGMFRLYFH